MSIYASAVVLADETAPLLYQGSHVMPSADDPRGNEWQSGGDFELAEIPGYVEHDGRTLCPDPMACDGTCVYPWLRASIGGQSVVLTVEQVRAIHEYTGRWLARVAESREFSEPGEPVADVVAAFDAGEKGVTAPPVEVVHMTQREWDEAQAVALAKLGMTYDELAAEARAGDFRSTEAHKLWVTIGRAV